MKNVILGLLMISMSACTSLGMRGGASGTMVAKMKSVAVFSVVTNELHHDFVGTTIFQNKTEDVDASSWQINRTILEQMVRSLKNNPQFTKVEILKSSLTPAELLAKEGVQKLIAAAKAAGYDSLVAIWPTSYSNAPMYRPGMDFTRQSAFGNGHTGIGLLAVMRLYDLNVGDSVAWQWTFDDISGTPGIVTQTDLPWKETYADYSATEKKQIETTMKDHIAIAIPYSMKALNLTK